MAILVDAFHVNICYIATNQSWSWICLKYFSFDIKHTPSNQSCLKKKFQYFPWFNEFSHLIVLIRCFKVKRELKHTWFCLSKWMWMFWSIEIRVFTFLDFDGFFLFFVFILLFFFWFWHFVILSYLFCSLFF